MLGLIVANLRRRSARTSLTAAGIAVGVASIVALLALSAGLQRTAGQLVHLGRADLGLFQRDAGDPTSSVLPLSLLPRVRAQPEIVGATPLPLGTMLLAYTLGQAGSIFSLPGATEGGLLGLFLLYGAPLTLAAPAILLYRAVQTAVPLVLGLIGVADLRHLQKDAPPPTEIARLFEQQPEH
jgi:uncharacterized membrane protein YbhN (UPF0104 family)